MSFTRVAGSILVLLFFRSCTDNPFIDTPLLEPHQINGKVQLADGGTADSIFIWLQGFNLSTYTDIKGEFKILLPPREVQGDGAGYSGHYPLWYFLANYTIASVSIGFSAGEVSLGQTDIDANGRFYNPVILEKLLDISTGFLSDIPDSILEMKRENHAADIPVPGLDKDVELLDSMVIDFNQPQFFSIFTRLETQAEPVAVETMLLPLGPGNPATHSGLLFFPIDGNGSVMVYDQIESFVHRYEFGPHEEHYWQYLISTEWLNLEPGRYRIVPYLWIVREDAPYAVRYQAGNYLDLLGYGVRVMPMKRHEASLIVVRSDS
jgi:hypothetical protein